MKVTRKNGNMCAKIRCAHTWSVARKIGLTKARSFTSIACNCSHRPGGRSADKQDAKIGRRIAPWLQPTNFSLGGAGLNLERFAEPWRETIFLLLLFIPAHRNTCRYDSARLGRVHADCDAHRHARFQIGNGRSLSIHVDFCELCNDECSRRFLFTHSNRVSRHA